MNRAPAVTVETLDAARYEASIPELAGLIVDAVASGAGVNFLAGVTTDEAAAWWRKRLPDVADGTTTAFVATDDDGRIVGSTLLVRSPNANSPNRASIGKVIVHSSARRRGIAHALMTAAEERARADGRWLLVLDTVSGSDADRLYRTLGWTEFGTVPDYGLLPDRTPAAATFFWKDVR